MLLYFLKTEIISYLGCVNLDKLKQCQWLLYDLDLCNFSFAYLQLLQLSRVSVVPLRSLKYAFQVLFTTLNWTDEPHSLFCYRFMCAAKRDSPIWRQLHNHTLQSNTPGTAAVNMPSCWPSQPVGCYAVVITLNTTGWTPAGHTAALKQVCILKEGDDANILWWDHDAEELL